MTDLGWSVLWLGVLALGIGVCMLLHQLGVATTYVRDLLHVGTGVWVLGWAYWQRPIAPVAIAVGALVAISLVPWAARRNRWVARFRDAVSDGDERFGGLALYVLSYAGLTLVSFVFGAFAAAAGLLALSLGDGIGGAVGRRFGRHRFHLPGAKPKSVEGSLAVALAAAAGVWIAAWRFGIVMNVALAAGLGLGAAFAEALSPRGTDNVLVPAVVWGLAELST